MQSLKEQVESIDDNKALEVCALLERMTRREDFEAIVEFTRQHEVICAISLIRQAYPMDLIQARFVHLAIKHFLNLACVAYSISASPWARGELRWTRNVKDVEKKGRIEGLCLWLVSMI